MDVLRRYEGIFTNPIPTDKCPVAAGAGSFVGIGASIKRRVETVAGLNRHPVRSRPERAANTARHSRNRSIADFEVCCVPGFQTCHACELSNVCRLKVCDTDFGHAAETAFMVVPLVVF